MKKKGCCRVQHNINKFYEENIELHKIPKRYIQRYINTTKVFCSDKYLCYIVGCMVHIYVYEESQTKWFPRKLIREVGHYWFNNNNNDFLYTTVDVRNNKAHYFVQKIGFTQIGKRGCQFVYELSKENFITLWCSQQNGEYN